MKVYAVVNQAEYEGYDILSVWDTKSKALDAATAFVDNQNEGCRYFIKKFYTANPGYDEDGVYVMELEVLS
jgi:hypothetical protein